MSDTPAPAGSAFGAWVRRESWRAGRSALVLLAAGLALVFTLDALGPGFAPRWSRFNNQLARAALDQHPLALARLFANRLGDSEYGAAPLSALEPFNITAARARLQRDFPEFIGVDADGRPQMLESSRMKKTDPAGEARRAADYLARHHRIEAARFHRLYGPEDPLNPPDASIRLARVVTRMLGLPDALLYTGRSIAGAGMGSALLSGLVLALAAIALGQSRRPARRWLKILVWPGYASALVWLAILAMSAGAALFGAFTPDTPALALLTALPLLLLCARLPLRFAETLVKRPSGWDGSERRRNRLPATPPPGGTIPPMGGA